MRQCDFRLVWGWPWGMEFHILSKHCSLFFFSFKFYFTLFTTLCWFQVHSKVIEFYIHIYIYIYIYTHTHKYVSILFQAVFPYRLLQNIEHSSLCFTEGLCQLSILLYLYVIIYIVVNVHVNAKFLIYTSSHLFPLTTISLLSKSVSVL